MATESFYKDFIIDYRSEKCIEDILKGTKPIIINCKKNIRSITKNELRDLFEK